MNWNSLLLPTKHNSALLRLLQSGGHHGKLQIANFSFSLAGKRIFLQKFIKVLLLLFKDIRKHLGASDLHLNNYFDWVVGEINAGGATFLPAGLLRIRNLGLESGW